MGHLPLCNFLALGLDYPGSVLDFQTGPLQAVLAHAEELASLGQGCG